jgi:hypothetical protein
MSFELQTIEESREAESRPNDKEILIENTESDWKVSDDSIPEESDYIKEANPAQKLFTKTKQLPIKDNNMDFSWLSERMIIYV